MYHLQSGRRSQIFPGSTHADASRQKYQQQQQPPKQRYATMSVNGDFAAGNLKVTAVDVQPTAENQRRTRNGKFTLGQLRATDAIVPLQYGTNQFDSQKGMTAFGNPRDVHGKHLKRIWELEFPDEANNFNQIPVNSQQASPR